MTDDLTPTDGTSRRRPSAMTVLAAGSLGGLLLGFGGVAAAADEPATATPPSASTAQDGAADDELCDEPGGPAAPDASGSASPETSAGSDAV